jgi:hypothetical protein
LVKDTIINTTIAYRHNKDRVSHAGERKIDMLLADVN